MPRGEVVQAERQSWVDAMPGDAVYVIQSSTVSISHLESERRSFSEPPTQEASQRTKPNAPLVVKDEHGEPFGVNRAWPRRHARALPRAF